MYSPEGREAVQVGVRRLGNVKAVWTMFDLREMSPDQNIGASWTITQRRGQWTDEVSGAKGPSTFTVPHQLCYDIPVAPPRSRRWNPLTKARLFGRVMVELLSWVFNNVQNLSSKSSASLS